MDEFYGNLHSKLQTAISSDPALKLENGAKLFLSPDTVAHFYKVAIISIKFGEKVTKDKLFLRKLLLAAFLHDLGKLYMPDIVHKEDLLDHDELNIIYSHTLKAPYLLKKTTNGLYDWDVVEIIVHHHERWDGSGYPDGLSGNIIPLGARIIAIADAYDAITSNRPYQVKSSNKNALEKIKKCAGTQFDPYLVNIFSSLLEKNDLQFSYLKNKMQSSAFKN